MQALAPNLVATTNVQVVQNIPAPIQPSQTYLKQALPGLIFFFFGGGSTVAAALENWEYSLGLFGAGLLAEIVYARIFIGNEEARIAARAQALSIEIQRNAQLEQQATMGMGQLTGEIEQISVHVDGALDAAEKGRVLSGKMKGQLEEDSKSEERTLVTAVSTSDLNQQNVDTTRHLESVVDQQIQQGRQEVQSEDAKLKANRAFLDQYKKK